MFIFRRWMRRFFRAIFWLVVIVILTPVAGLAYGFLTTSNVPAFPKTGSPPSVELQEQTSGIAGYYRPEESTFLTYPEWSIVYAAREYAQYVENNRESGFAYWPYIGRYWQDYALVIRATRAYPFNIQNHLMLVVIGTSHSIENAIQWAWENSIGRATELAAPRPVAEDTFQANTAAEYAAFLDQVPWYRFAYAEKRSGLWSTETASGRAAIRSWERKLAFGLSYTIKQGYAAAIASGLSATSDPALLDIHVWATGPVALAINGEPDTKLELDLGENGAIFVTKRYQVFTEMIPRLINRGLRIVEIGGNKLIFVTVLSDGPLTALPGTSSLFSYPVPADPETWRTGIVSPVGTLHETIPALQKSGATLEHIYDY